MGSVAQLPNIQESFLEHRQVFPSAWVERWTLPNPFLRSLHGLVRELGGNLGDFSFSKESANVGDTFLNIAIRSHNAAVRIGLDSITFSAANPDWSTASQLVSVFQRVAAIAAEIIETVPLFQETTLAIHVVSDDFDFRKATSALVNTGVVGECDFYGVSLHRGEGTIIIDKSLRYLHAAFIRLQRKFPGEDSFAHIAAAVYEDELFALRLLGLPLEPNDHAAETLL